MLLNKYFWNNRYATSEIGWDIGRISTPLKEYFDQLKDKKMKILIPGCGNSYEAEYLFENHFTNTFVADYSEYAINNFRKRVPRFSEFKLFNNDFFDLEGKYDLIIEQTFFCAIDKRKRSDYFIKMNDLLNPNGKLVGLLFDDSLNDSYPPFGGSKSEYEEYFFPYFFPKVFEKAYNSIDSRMGRELFMILIKKEQIK
tara:strand:+ start:70 stop:663 length:594 start_codon:yes stop_codon:yes gene_type:complete